MSGEGVGLGAGDGAPLRLVSGSRVAVLGGGPAGSFFSYFLLQIAERARLNLRVDVYEPRDFSRAGAGSCNMCGGIVSESLLQSMVAEGIRLPPDVVQRRLDSYFLHMDVGSVRIETPLGEKRIAAVYRGGGPKGRQAGDFQSLDGHLLSLAAARGARVIQRRVTEVGLEDGRPRVAASGGAPETYDLLVGAAGVNTALLKSFEGLGIGYRAPQTTKAYVCEFFLGRDMVDRYFGGSMHVFLLNMPRLEFAAIIPKGSYVTVCLLGEDVDRALVDAFLGSPEVKRCMPPHWRAPDGFCHCYPRIVVHGCPRPFGDRVVFVGDCGTTRLYKDGIGAAWRTAKAAAVTAVFRGISAEDFRRHYLPACRRIETDNRIGKLVFAVTRGIQSRRFARRGVWKMTSREQTRAGSHRRMSLVLWDTFTGSAPYRTILGRTFHPLFWSRLVWETATGVGSRSGVQRRGRVRMASGATGILGKKYAEGEVIYHQGERGNCMYVIQGGEVEVIRRDGDKEFCLATLGDGDFFGEMGLFEEEVRSATVRASTDVWVFTLERDSLLRRIHEDPSLAFRIIQKMTYRIRDLEAALVRRASTPA